MKIFTISCVPFSGITLLHRKDQILFYNWPMETEEVQYDEDYTVNHMHYHSVNVTDSLQLQLMAKESNWKGGKLRTDRETCRSAIKSSKSLKLFKCHVLFFLEI